ncbi:TPA: sel1 repeat family protein [Providencia stuartii]|nr:sel1 repeat family protein [Providencia stuartii]HAU5774774.1 sel1 repeat family protein [Providencia stuartii]
MLDIFKKQYKTPYLEIRKNEYFNLIDNINLLSQRLEESEKTKTSAELSDKDAQFNLGLMYYQGDGVPVSIEQAQKWFMRAAEQGNAYAQYNLGWLMQKGEVENTFPYAARYYFELACKGGLEKACFALEKSHSEHF